MQEASNAKRRSDTSVEGRCLDGSCVRTVCVALCIDTLAWRAAYISLKQRQEQLYSHPKACRSASSEQSGTETTGSRKRRATTSVTPTSTQNVHRVHTSAHVRIEPRRRTDTHRRRVSRRTWRTVAHQRRNRLAFHPAAAHTEWRRLPLTRGHHIFATRHRS